MCDNIPLHGCCVVCALAGPHPFLCVGVWATPELGLINGAKQLKETEADLCTTFAEDYLTTQGFFALAALCIVVVNVLLRLLMRCKAHACVSVCCHPLANTAGGVLLQTWLALSTITLAQQSPLPCPKRYQDTEGRGGAM